MLPSPSACILGNLILCSRDALLEATARFYCQSLHGPSFIFGSRPNIGSLSLTGSQSVPIFRNRTKEVEPLLFFVHAASVGTGHSGRFVARYNASSMLRNIKCLETPPSLIFNTFFVIVFVPSLLPFRRGYALSRFSEFDEIYQAGRRSGNTSHLHSGDARFDSWPGPQLSRLKFLVALLSPSRQATTVAFRIYPSWSYVYHHTSKAIHVQPRYGKLSLNMQQKMTRLCDALLLTVADLCERARCSHISQNILHKEVQPSDSWVRVTLRLAVCRQSVHLADKPHETHDQHSFQLNTCFHSPYVTSTLTRGWVCSLQFLLALASPVILRY
jgi:hypothetical protein